MKTWNSFFFQFQVGKRVANSLRVEFTSHWGFSQTLRKNANIANYVLAVSLEKNWINEVCSLEM